MANIWSCCQILVTTRYPCYLFVTKFSYDNSKILCVFIIWTILKFINIWDFQQKLSSYIYNYLGTQRQGFWANLKPCKSSTPWSRVVGLNNIPKNVSRKIIIYFQHISIYFNIFPYISNIFPIFSRIFPMVFIYLRISQYIIISQYTSLLARIFANIFDQFHNPALENKVRSKCMITWDA